VVRGSELLAVGERERGRAARPGAGLEPPGAQLPALPPPHLVHPHRPFCVRGAPTCAPGVPSASAAANPAARAWRRLCAPGCLVTALTGLEGISCYGRKASIEIGGYIRILIPMICFVWQVAQEEGHAPQRFEASRSRVEEAFG